MQIIKFTKMVYSPPVASIWYDHAGKLVLVANIFQQ